MISSRIVSALAAAAMLAAGASAAKSVDPDAWKEVKTHIEEATKTLPANAMSTIGCFETAIPLENHGDFLFRSPGNCQFICIELKKPVLGLSDGENCWCGDMLPPESHQVNDTLCDTDCRGDDTVKCGGPDLVQVILSGTTKNRIPHMEELEEEISSTAERKSSSTKAPELTASATPTDEPEEKGGPNKAGIAAGVVVGVVGLAAIIGGVIFFLRQKKRREIEEEHRRREATNPFFGHSSSTSMTDSRLDPSYMDRRQSNGSIADNEDFSRRILKVTNA